jgi:hypothetical protein
MRRMRVTAVAIAVSVMIVGGAGPAAAGAGPTEASATGWLVENPRTDGLFDTHEGSATIGLASGVTISCPLVDGWGRADSGTLRPQDLFGETGINTFAGCTGTGAAGLEVVSSPSMGLAPDAYDAGADRISGSALPQVWGLFLDAPDCELTLYAVDSDAPAPLTYDNRTATLDVGPIPVVVDEAAGTGCAGLGEVGDEMTYAFTYVATPGFTVRPA